MDGTGSQHGWLALRLGWRRTYSRRRSSPCC